MDLYVIRGGESSWKWEGGGGATLAVPTYQLIHPKYLTRSWIKCLLPKQCLNHLSMCICRRKCIFRLESVCNHISKISHLHSSVNEFLFNRTMRTSFYSMFSLHTLQYIYALFPDKLTKWVWSEQYMTISKFPQPLVQGWSISYCLVLFYS